MVTSTQQGEDRRSDSTHTACRSDGTDTTFEGCQALLEDVGRGVIEAGIEVGRDLQVKDPSSVVSTIKSEGIRLIKGTAVEPQFAVGSKAWWRARVDTFLLIVFVVVCGVNSNGE